MTGAEEKSQSKKRVLKKGNHSQNQENIKGGGDFGSSNRRRIYFSMYADVLECSICCEVFRPPIYQCQNGHAVCSPCCPALSGKCPVCSEPIGLIRCLALESVLESVQIGCKNFLYGCNSHVSYLHRDTHYKICNYKPCSCPVSSCAFKGSAESLSYHFQSLHRNSAVEFRYGCCFDVALNRTKNPFLVLLGPDGRLFLLLNNNDPTRGSVLSMICIASLMEKSNFEYELSVGENTTTLKLKSSVERTTEWKGVYPTDICLIVPKGFCSPNMIVVGVSINKC
ncbi:hypothetical protein J5N97_027871 [Dioscorea zingiberensis]|uniref:RING-type E3 ubiquitin transferase n=1 Tax=Dioscorea zingiberensis TaxID=325984 RepID=A0A9D5H4D3_9LILI|nr:hypothetical protein J5N97_027871 [Dioscorea zingiberensis]